MREKPRPPVQVFAYDDTLGADEGRELESLLAYFPASAPVASKVRALSLARGIVGFASQFSIGSEGAEGADTAVRREDARVVRTKRGRLACLLATPSSRGSRTHGGGSRLWLCASLDDSIATSTAVRDGALVDALRILRDDHAMLHGDTSPPSSRNLSPLVADLGARLSPPTTGWVGMQSTHGGEKRLCGSALHALHSPLAPPTGCPLTSTSREVFLLTQSAVNAATLALDDWADDAKDDDNSDDDDVNDKDDDLVADTAVFHEGGMLWSSATVRATRAIARYAERCLVPGVAFGEGDGVGVTRTRESDVAGASSRGPRGWPETRKPRRRWRRRRRGRGRSRRRCARRLRRGYHPYARRGSAMGRTREAATGAMRPRRAKWTKFRCRRRSGRSRPTGSCGGPAPRARPSRRAVGTCRPPRTSSGSTPRRPVRG